MLSRLLLLLSLLLIAPRAFAAAPGCSVATTPLERLESSELCNACRNYFLPGRNVPSPFTRYTVHSDLPEVMLTPGVLYATTPVLPPFDDFQGNPICEEMRTQRNNGYRGITDSFEVFLFHISQPGNGKEPRRVVVYARNNGKSPVVLTPRQQIVTDGIIGTVHEMENNLGKRVLEEVWDTPISSTVIQPGKGAVVAYSKQFAAPRNGPDSSANVNCFGIVRADVKGKDPNLDVFVVGVPAKDSVKGLREETEKLLTKGAKSGETYIRLDLPPVGCQLRRATGVFESVVWQADDLVLDAARLKEGIPFQMALTSVHSAGCEPARQTTDLLLHPPTTRPDTIGNYMQDFYVPVQLVNLGTTETLAVDLRFGKNDADIGLGWQLFVGDEPKSLEALTKLQAHSGWAGPKQQADGEDNTRSFLEYHGGPIVLKPCEQKFVSIRFLVLGNASLPFQIHARSAPVPAGE